MKRLSGLSRLALIRAKVERAQKNLTDMEAVLSNFHGAVPGRPRYIKALKSKHGESIQFTLPIDCLAAAGDVVNNLRSALDHLAYQMADAYTSNCSDKVLERTAFPIGDDMAGYQLAKRRIAKVVHPQAVALIDRMEPYKDGNPLRLLNKLNNINKHRTLLTVGEVVICTADWVSEMSVSNTFMYKVKDPQFVGIYAKPGEVDYVQFGPRESIGDPQKIGGDAMLPTLSSLIDFIRNLIPQFLPFLEPHESVLPRDGSELIT